MKTKQSYDNDDLRSLLPHASESQRRAIEALIKSGSSRRAAKALGCAKSSITASVERARKASALAVMRTDHDTSLAYATTTLYRDPTPDSEMPLQWVKRNASLEQQASALEAVARGLSDDLPRIAPTKAPNIKAPDLANLFVVTDYHLGQLSWGEETGDDWDLDIAEDLLTRWFAHAVKASPDADTAILGQLGDFMHWDGMDAVTPTSGHLVDVDTRYQKLVRVAMRSIRRIIDMLLETHTKVHVISATGNHDLSGSVWLREMIAAVYENEPRLNVDLSPSMYYSYQHGETSLFFHHGHKCKVGNVDRVFASQFRDMFGTTRHSYAHLGHLHHTEVKESQLMVTEQHRTMAAKDAHAASGGYLSGRSAPVITYHKKYGEVGRMEITPEMVS